MAQLLAQDVTAAESASFTLATGESATLSLFGTGSPAIPKCSVRLQYQASTTEWFEFGELNDNEPIKVVRSAGVFRVKRNQCSYPVGVDKV